MDGTEKWAENMKKYLPEYVTLYNTTPIPVFWKS